MDHANEHICMEMGKATADCTPVPFDTDVWTQVAKHGPGQKKGPATVTNRSVIYKLHPPEGGPFLAILSGLWVDEEADQPFKGLRELEAQTGAAVRFILAPGAQHHLSLSHYARAFPDARVCVAEGRIPRANPELMALPNVHAYPIDSPPAELAEAGLRILVLKGLMEGQKTKRFQLMTAGVFGYVPRSTEPLMVLHVPTGAITSGGHQWWYTPPDEAQVFDMPGVMHFVTGLLGMGFGYLRSGAIALETNHVFAVHDREALQASCQEFLGWEFDQLIDLHAHVNKCLRQGAKALFEEALGAIVEGRWSDVPWDLASAAADD